MPKVNGDFDLLGVVKDVRVEVLTKSKRLVTGEEYESVSDEIVSVKVELYDGTVANLTLLGSSLGVRDEFEKYDFVRLRSVYIANCNEVAD